MKKLFKPFMLVLGLAVVATGCKKDDDTDPLANEKEQFVAMYADVVLAGYQDSHEKAVALKNAIDAFVAAPSQSLFDDAKAAWLEAREPYGQTEAFRFANGPIDDNDGPEGLLNAWPLDESHIDYVYNDLTMDTVWDGIINDPATYPNITGAYLETLNEEDGEANISVGYHAIEFLLWGQDKSTTTGGERPFTDFVDNGTATNQDRRRDYLAACAELLVGHLADLVAEWEAGGAYRTTFLAKDKNVAITEILTGIGTLSKSELAGERMFVALDNQDQEDEHSCFSDNTDRDIVTNAMGIHNIIQGSYTRTNGSMVTGTSLIDLVTASNETLGTELNTISNDVITKVNAIGDPFDQAILAEDAGGNGPIMEAVRKLQDQGDKIAEVGSEFGLSVSTE